MFAPDRLTVGVFLPLRRYEGSMKVLAGQADLVTEIDRHGFAAVWVRDVPLFDPSFGLWVGARASGRALRAGDRLHTPTHAYGTLGD